MPTIAVVGGGISGLTAAYRLRQSGAHPTLFEHGPRLGGAIRTFRQEGWLLEAGPDSLLRTKPAAMELAQELGIELVESCSLGPPGIVRNGQVIPIPEGLHLMAPTRLLPFLTSRILSLPGKLRAACEALVPRRSETSDESVAQFVARRFGLELMELIAQPLIGGIYAADLSRLSLQATLPTFEALERQKGSVTAGLLGSLNTKSAPKSPLFLTPRDGMEALITALADKIPSEDLRCNQPVLRISRRPTGWEIQTATTIELFDGVVFACSSQVATKLLAEISPESCESLSPTVHVSTATINLMLDENQITKNIVGSGFVVPHFEGLELTACTFAHRKFPYRAPAGKALIRLHLGNAMNQNVLKHDDFHLIKHAIEQVRPLIGLQGQPEESFIARQKEVLPQYGVGHSHRIARAKSSLSRHRGLILAGNGLTGVGISDCIMAATTATDSLLGALQ